MFLATKKKLKITIESDKEKVIEYLKPNCKEFVIILDERNLSWIYCDGIAVGKVRFSIGVYYFTKKKNEKKNIIHSNL